MKRYAKFLTALIFLLVTAIVFVAGVALGIKVGEETHSGLLGICGPYGSCADLVGLIFLCSFPAAIIAGVFSAKMFYRRAVNEPKI